MEPVTIYMCTTLMNMHTDFTNEEHTTKMSGEMSREKLYLTIAMRKESILMTPFDFKSILY